MKIICLAGPMGSGKDVVAEYLRDRHNYHIFHYSDTLRAICRNEHIEVTRDNLQNLRLKYGNTFLAEAIVAEIHKSKFDKIVLTPMRRSEDFLIPKKAFPLMVFILISAPERVRFERLAARDRENDAKTMEEFRRQEGRESEIYDFSKTFSYADYVVENDGTIETLKTKIDKLIQEIEK